MKKLFLAVLLSAVSMPVMVFAQGVPESTSSVIGAYRFYKEVSSSALKVPTVFEVPLSEDVFSRNDFVVYDTTNQAFEPHFVKRGSYRNEVPVTMSTYPVVLRPASMYDGDMATYSDFPLPEKGVGSARIVIEGQQEITSSALSIALDNNVALPSSVEIRAIVGGQERIVVATTRMTDRVIRFPQTKTETWIVTFSFHQPLRISELRLAQDGTSVTSVASVRFLAQPERLYRVYFDADRYVRASVGEAGNLAGAQGVKMVSGTSMANPAYVIADSDADGVADIFDNCVSVSNADQIDIDGNRRGDVCDDFDQDGIINSKDNCPNIPNRGQEDTDGDGIGDVCDTEESRLTERHAWIPWAGMGMAGLVLLTLLVLTLKSTNFKLNESAPTSPQVPPPPKDTSNNNDLSSGSGTQ